MTQSPLSPRETEVFRLLAEGMTPTEIARCLGLKSNDTVNNYLQRIRRKLEVRTNEQAVLKAAWHHAGLLKGCMVKHGTLEALDWHEDHEIPLCEPCGDIVKARERRVKVPPVPRRAPGDPYRRLTPVPQHAKRGQPVEHGTIQMARRHIAAHHRISELECGCREAYREWWQAYDKERRALGA